MCGAIFVDAAFQDFLRGRLSRRYDKITPVQLKKIMNDEWEHGIKRGFDDTEREWEVRLPADAVKTGIFTGKRERESRAGLKLARCVTPHIRDQASTILTCFNLRGVMSETFSHR